MSLLDKVIAVLRYPRNSVLDFFLENFHIDANLLHTAGKALEEGKLHVETGPVGTQLEAAYSSHNKTITIKSEQVPDSPAGRAILLHEGFHAAVDLLPSKPLSDLNEEVASYLVEVIFRNHFEAFKSGEDPLLDIAHVIASVHRLYKKQGVKLTTNDCRSFRELICTYDAYQSYCPQK
jgi:hypothetical protein